MRGESSLKIIFVSSVGTPGLVDVIGYTVRLSFEMVQTDNHRYMGVSKNRGGPPKSSILIGFSIINHPFLGFTPIFRNTHICTR